jgi:isopropylmalate/homocitrate/citramalate synthase
MKLIECPRDAMQGLHDYLSVKDKVRYINAILKVGFDTIDAGSFVSPKAIPQLKDTAEVLSKLDMSSTKTKEVQRKPYNLMRFLIWVFLFLFLKLFKNGILIRPLKIH